MFWIISLNSHLGHIYDYEPKKHTLALLESLENPSSQLKGSELISDRPGHYQTMHSARGAYETTNDPQEVELDRFVKNIAEILKKGLDNHHYKQFILCASPHVGGILLNNLHKQVKHALLINIKKNFVELNPSVLRDYLKKNWWDILRSNRL